VSQPPRGPAPTVDARIERDGQIVVRAFLRQVRRRQVHDDAVRRHREAHAGERRANTLPAFSDGLVGQSDDDETRQSAGDLHLNIHPARFHADERHRHHPRRHVPHPDWART
jgi:hypothetical protein